MSLLQINTAIPLAEPLLEQHEAGLRNIERRTNQDLSNNSQSAALYKTKFILLGVLTGFLIQVVSLGAYAFLLVHNYDFEKEDNASTTTAALMTGYLKQQQQQNQDDSSESSSNNNTNTIMYTILSVLTQVDLIVYVLIWIAFTCTMTRNGMSCIRRCSFQFFNGIADANTDASSKTIGKSGTSTSHRRYVFVLGVNFLIGIVLGAFLAWTIIDIYLDFPIPFKPILFTVTIDLILCYFMICCYDMGGNGNNGSNKIGKCNKDSNTDDNDDSDDDYSDSDSDSDDDARDSSSTSSLSWC